MLLPTLSVTAIGLIAAVVAIGLRRRPGAATLLGVLGAWAGFLAAGVVAVLVEVVTGTGGLLVVLGHLGAVAGACLAALRAGRRG